MNVDASHDAAVLHALGAARIAEVRDGETDALIGYDVSPDIDLSGYDTALKSVMAARRVAAVAAINAEAQRRILLVAPDWKQRNFTARDVRLMQKRLATGSLDPDEQAQLDESANFWASIEAVQNASNHLTAMETMPSDYTADHYWP